MTKKAPNSPSLKVKKPQKKAKYDFKRIIDNELSKNEVRAVRDFVCLPANPRQTPISRSTYDRLLRIGIEDKQQMKVDVYYRFVEIITRLRPKYANHSFINKISVCPTPTKTSIYEPENAS